MTLQQQVQQHLQNTGISLRELSRRSGISHQAIGKILRGGEYKNKTAYALNTVILRDSNFAKIVCSAEDQPSDFVLENRHAFETLDATVEQLAAQCIDADLTHVRDTDLECAKYRRVMQLDQQLNDANTAYLSSKSQHERDLQRLNDAQDKLEYMKLLAGEDGRKLQDYQAQISKAEAMILGLNDSNECLQKQLDHGQAVYSKLCSQLGATRTKYETQLESASQKEARLQEQLTEVYATKTRQEAQIMRLRMYVWSLIAALVLVLVSSLVVWGGV